MKHISIYGGLVNFCNLRASQVHSEAILGHFCLSRALLTFLLVVVMCVAVSLDDK